MSTIDGLTVEERGGPEGPCSCDMSVSHYAGCPCHEARWAERLAAAEARARRAEGLARFGALMLSNWWNDGFPSDIDGSDGQELAEKTGLWHQVERHSDGVECDWCGGEGPCGELTEAGLAALAPPPEAEKKGGGGMTAPAAPLEKAVAGAREALANNCHPYTECMDEGVSCYQRMDDALRNLLAALDADLPALRLALETATTRIASLESTLKYLGCTATPPPPSDAATEAVIRKHRSTLLQGLAYIARESWWPDDASVTDGVRYHVGQMRDAMDALLTPAPAPSAPAMRRCRPMTEDEREAYGEVLDVLFDETKKGTKP